MKKILTKDNSYRFYNEEYNETYHSVSGALEEAFKKYIEPCKIQELAKKGEISIMDICFGLGYNSLAAVYTALKENPKCQIEIIALEKDENILEKLKTIVLPPELEFYYEKIKEQIKNLTISFNNVTIKIILGDATETIKSLNQKFDVSETYRWSKTSGQSPLSSREGGMFLSTLKCQKNLVFLITLRNFQFLMNHPITEGAYKCMPPSKRVVFDVIFLDPFSPKKNPELWSYEFFKDIKKFTKPDTILATYSCAKKVRENLKQAGFKVKEGPCVGRKAPSTIAFL